MCGTVRMWAAAAMLLAPGLVRAQAVSCAVPGTIPRPHPEDPSADQPRRLLPIGGYTLALTWSPEYCHGHIAGRSRGGDDMECGGANRFGFTLHGLWPDGVGREWPQYCRAAPLIAPATIRKHLCQSPSAQLMQHEWAKHGTCMPGDPEQYFARSGSLYSRLRFPDMTALSYDRSLTAGRLATAIAGANPGLPASTIRVTINRNGWLNELWLCLDRRFAYARCRADSGGADAASPVKIFRGSSRRRGGGDRGDDG